ncbi:hypothetical protein CPLU01_05976 [Colletotrichum plurivorum]|uniref:Uncharacterized protein n=1 Tax=Colletotrichum plurivorum TaxID=2175906 RepID=A0A8H6NGI6_9PEZI|nr:hypothetical protein CPLU01_05976 [Colletotrichum plurivorum]
MDSTIICGSHIDRISGQRSTHSTAPESWVTQAEESQPLSGKHALSPTEGSHPPTNSNSNRLYWQTWWLEILSSLLALSCLVAMITILGIHQGQLLPKWPDIISINSLISILTAVFKASLIMPIAEGLGQLKWEWFRRPRYLADIEVFDNASRGPWGSFLLIIGQIPRSDKAFAAGLGAFVTILALAVDPSSQAMIRHRTCDRELDNDLAQLARTNIYDGRSGRYSRYGADGDVHESMVRAIYRGLVDHQETSALLDFKCATGNCTFGQRNGQGSNGAFFSSLALCHFCHDISDKITRNGSAWQLHPGHAVWNLDNTTVRATWDIPRSPVFVAQNSPGPKSIWRSFSSFDFLSLSNDTYNDGTFGGTLKAFAVRCSLQPCVKTYHAEVLNSAYKEIEYKAPGERLKEYHSSHSFKQYGLALITNSTFIDGLEHICAESPYEAPGTVRFDEKYGLLGSSDPSCYYPKECIWAVERTSWLGIDSVFQDVFIDGLTKTSEDLDLGTVRGPIWLREMFAGGQGNLSTVEEVVRGVAQSVTAAMRNKPFGDSSARGEDVPAHLKYASGRAVVPDTCIDVVWGWLAYPLTLLVLQWIFSALVLLNGWKVGKAGEERILWKSSPIPLLFHGLDEDLREKNGDLMSLRQMDGVSGTLKVQLAPAGGQKRKGWRLCES